MAGVVEGLDVRIEWLEAPGVSTAELAATWARYELWIADDCVTQVETADGNVRRSLFGSLYPLAEWVADNWWLLGDHLRPSGVESRYWTWVTARNHGWLRHHNIRGAGDGMPWPNLTLVPDGDASRLRWFADRSPTARNLRFLSSGDAWMSTSRLLESLARLVDHVLDRLKEQGITKSRLAEEWEAIGSADAEEAAFCRTAARMGLDPYAIDDLRAEEIVAVAEALPEGLVTDFFNSAVPTAIRQAAEWINRTVPAAAAAAASAQHPLDDLRAVALATAPVQRGRPWQEGYALAGSVREALHLSPTERFDISGWVGSEIVQLDSAGLQGTVVIDKARCGVVLQYGRPSSFGHARALGRSLLKPQQRSFILSAAGDHDERASRAFAAELLAPAAGIREKLDALGGDDDIALDAVAQDFDVSSLVVRHQYDNQLAGVYE